MCSNTENKKTVCKYCGKEIDKSCIDAHHRGHENQIKEKYKCNDCGKVFSTSNMLKIHFESVHADKTGVICPKCSKQLAHKRSLKSHLKICQTNIQLKCELCNRAFKTPSGLRNHKIIQINIVFSVSFVMIDLKSKKTCRDISR